MGIKANTHQIDQSDLVLNTLKYIYISSSTSIFDLNLEKK